MAEQGPFRRGEILTAQKLNEAFSGRPIAVSGSGRLSRDAKGDVVTIDQPETIYLRLTGKTGTTPIKYSWKEVYRNAAGAWVNTDRTGTTSGDYAIELNNSNLSTTDNFVYRAERSPESGEWLFDGESSFSTSGKDIVLMILGDYNSYKDCPGVPADPPKDANGNFCWPPYAWSAYKVCGYKYTKLFDMRDFGQWATELNGGGTSSYRRFFPAFWGWDTFTDGYDPTGSVNCAGVRFLGYNSQGALTCTCPTWLANVQCFKVTVKFIPEVTCTAPNTDCDCNLDFWTNMANLWGTEQTVILCNNQMGCAWQGDLTPFNLTLGWSPAPYDADENGNCSWGPTEFDPCYPCDGFSRMSLSINSNFGNGGGAGNVYDTFKVDVKTIRELINDCTTGPVTLPHDTFKGHCPGGSTSVFEWVKVECCSVEEAATCV